MAISRRPRASTRPRRTIARGRAYEQENGQRPGTRTRRARSALPYYGFDHVELCSGHADRGAWHLHPLAARAQARRRSRCAARRTRCRPSYVAAAGLAHQPAGGALSDRYVVDARIAYLDGTRGARTATPFFLQCSFPDPHHPFTPPGRYWDMYEPQDMPAAAARSASATARCRRTRCALSCRARRRHPQRQHACRLRRERAGDARGHRAHLRHDRDDRRRHGAILERARRARPRPTTP